MMMRLIITVVLCSVALRSCSGQDPELRVNAGVAFYNIGKINMGSSSWTHSFMVKLLNVSVLPEELSPFESGCVLSGDSCLRLRSLVDLINHHRFVSFSRIKELDNMITKLLPEQVVRPKGSKKRAPWFGFVGSLASTLFGVATTGQLEQVKAHMIAYEEQLGNDRGAIVKLQDALSSYISVSDNRLGHLEKMIKLNHREMNRIQLVLKEMSNVTTMLDDSIRVLTYVLKNEIWYGEAMSEAEVQVNNWMRAIDVLFSGRLPVELISTKIMHEVLGNVSRDLVQNYPKFRLRHTHLGYYYRDAPIICLRTDQYLLVQVEIPIESAATVFELYSVLSFAIPVNVSSDMFTKIVDLPAFIAVNSGRTHYALIRDQMFRTCLGHGIRQCASGIAMTSRSYHTCASALFFDMPREVMQYCHIAYHIAPAERNPIIHLQTNKYLVLSPKTENDIWVMQCTGQNSQRIASCGFCVISLPCQCSLVAGDFSVPAHISDCKQHTNGISKLYPINLPAMALLQSDNFVKAGGLSKIFTHEPVVSLPDFELEERKWDKTVQLDNAYHLDYKKMALAIKNDEKLYKTRSDQLADSVHPFYSASSHVVLYCVVGIAGISIILLLILACRYRKLAALLSLMQASTHVTGAHARGLEVVSEQLAFNFSRVAEHIEQEVEFRYYIEWTVVVVIFYVAIRYILFDSYQLFGRRICRTSFLALPRPKLVGEILLEISNNLGASVILSLGSVPPTMWEVMSTTVTVGTVSVSSRWPLVIIEIQYDETKPFVGLLTQRFYAIEFLNSQLQSIVAGEMQCAFYIVHGTVCKLLSHSPGSQILEEE